MNTDFVSLLPFLRKLQLQGTPQDQDDSDADQFDGVSNPGAGASSGPNQAPTTSDPPMQNQLLQQAQANNTLGPGFQSTTSFNGQNPGPQLLAQSSGQPQASGQGNGNSKDNQLPPPDAQHNHTITVRKVSGQGPNIFGHVTVQLDGNDEVGYGPQRDMTAQDLATNASIPGRIEPRAAGTKTDDQVTIYVTADQAKAAQQTIDDIGRNPGNYVLYGTNSNNCANFAERVLNSAGSNVKHDVSPSGLVGDIRAQQYKDKSVQTRSGQQQGK